MVKGEVQAKNVPARRTSAVSASRKPISASSASPSGSVTGTRVSSATTSLPSCGGCGVLITDDTESLQCDRCQSDQWKCIECLNITVDVYDKLISDPACSLKWFCDGCDSVVSCLDVNSITSAVTNSVSNAMDRFADLLRDIEQNLVARIDTMKQKLGQKADLDEVRTIRSMLQAVSLVRRPI